MTTAFAFFTVTVTAQKHYCEDEVFRFETRALADEFVEALVPSYMKYSYPVYDDAEPETEQDKRDKKLTEKFFRATIRVDEVVIEFRDTQFPAHMIDQFGEEFYMHS